MSDPFAIKGPALISFSGGRTSGYMLWRIIQAHGGTLPADVKVTFANTGKEMPQTLDFVRDCGERWGVEIVWLEYADSDEPQKRWQRVTYETASRFGQPFKALIGRKQYLPNPVTRFCTIELKIRAMKLFAQQAMGWKDWTNVIGLRADEPSRVAKSRNSTDVWENSMPLVTAGVTKADVSRFWMQQNFDLRLPNINGKTALGNCDLCFLKSAATIGAIMRANPASAKWWIEAEAEAEAVTSNSLPPIRERKYVGSDPETDEPIYEYTSRKQTGAHFRQDRPSYVEMLDAVERQENFDFGVRDELIDCFCGDGA